jgi:glucose/arabinose dehydrogenase
MRVMIRVLAFIIVAGLCVAGCDNKPPETPDPGPGNPSGDVRVVPGSRLGWSQQAADATEVASLQFALYIDGARTTLTGANCTGAASGTGFDCSATLPSLSAGTHTLELAAFIIDGSVTLESARSAALRVVAGGTSGFSVSSQLIVTAEQVRLNLAPVAEGLQLPSDLAFAADGSIFVAERGGAVRLVRDGVLVETPALDLSLEMTRPEGGLLAIALDPRFDDNGLMYALYAVDAPRDGLEFTLARFRFVGGVFGERAVLLDRTKASINGASGALRAGPDGKLYVALDSASDGRIAGSFATYNGKVLRFNTDATTPDDQPGSNPIYSLEHPQPLALDWQPGSGTLWVVDRVGADASRLSAVVKSAGQSRAAFRTSYALPEGTGAASAAFYRGDLMAIFQGNLFIAAEMGRELMRLRFDPQNASKVVSVERMLHDRIGAVRVVAEGRDGALYIATESVLYRLAP